MLIISSLAASAKELAEAIRSHWAIKNSLHWVFDVTLGEDHFILNLLQNAEKKFKDMSIKRL